MKRTDFLKSATAAGRGSVTEIQTSAAQGDANRIPAGKLWRIVRTGLAALTVSFLVSVGQAPGEVPIRIQLLDQHPQLGQPVRLRALNVPAEHKHPVWYLEEEPPGSEAKFDNQTSSEASFVPDVLGLFRVRLTDGSDWTRTATLEVTVALPTRALVVGTEWVHGPGQAAGIVFEAIADRYKVTFGTGAEDPSDYALVVFDGNDTMPDALHNNPALANFLAAGKAVVILNNTEDHRRIGLNHLLWAHAQGSSPAVAFFIPRDRRGVPRMVVQIDFPVHSNTLNTTTPPTADQIAQDAKKWLATLRSRLHAVLKDAEPNAQDAEPSAASDGGGNINAPTTPGGTGAGQTALTIDDVVPGQVVLTSAWDTVVSDIGTCWIGVTNNDESCNPAYAPLVQTTVTFDIENMLSVLLEPNGSSYQDKIIARQYLLMSPNILSSEATIGCGFPTTTCQVFSLLGFNAASTLTLTPSGFRTGALAVTEALPEAMNNTTQLSTSNTHTETVGVSATAGYSGGAVGEVSPSFSDSWQQTEQSSVSITDWSSQNNESGPIVTYQYSATGGTNDTYLNLVKYMYPTWAGNQFLVHTPVNVNTQFNALQQSGMTSQSETVWTSANGPIPPGQYTIDASETPQFAEAYTTKNNTSGTPPSYGYLPLPPPLGSTFSLDFTNPTLQPPAPAPWTLSFGPYVPSSLGSGYEQTTGTVTLVDGASSSPTQINLSYVIQPKVALQTVPEGQICPGNQTSFFPGNAVVSNGSNSSSPPALSITIPAGQTQATFPLTLQTFTDNNYNVQVVAWQATGNLQAAWCLTPPN